MAASHIQPVAIHAWIDAPPETPPKTYYEAPLEQDTAEPVAIHAWIDAPPETAEPVAIHAWIDAPLEQDTAEVIVTTHSTKNPQDTIEIREKASSSAQESTNPDNHISLELSLDSGAHAAMAMNQKNGRFDQITLQWDSIAVSTQASEPSEPFYINRNLTGQAVAGELTGIIGPSGCGKTIFMDTLAQLSPSSLCIHGEISQRDMLNIRAAYCQQKDTLICTETAREAAMVRAHLVTPDWSPEERQRHVGSLIDDLGMSEFADVPIGTMGSHTHRLSGGQRRRAQILVEMVGFPSVLLLDEPTSGLDSTAALHIMASLVNICDKHRVAVICALHQPRRSLMNLFDTVCVMSSQGDQLHFGSQASIANACGQNVNVSDYVLDNMKLANDPDYFSGLQKAAEISEKKDVMRAPSFRLTSQSKRRVTVPGIDDMFNHKLGSATQEQPCPSSSGGFSPLKTTEARFSLFQVYVILRTLLQHHWRDRTIHYQLLRLVGCVSALMVAYYQLDDKGTSAGISERAFSSFYVLGAICSFELHHHTHQALFQRLKLECQLSIISQASAGLVMIVYCALRAFVNAFGFQCLLLMVGFGGSAEQVVPSFFAILLMNIIAGLLSYVLLIRSGDGQYGPATSEMHFLIIVPTMTLFAGVMFSVSRMPEYLRWMVYVNPLHYAFAIIFRAETNEVCDRSQQSTFASSLAPSSTDTTSVQVFCDEFQSDLSISEAMIGLCVVCVCLGSLLMVALLRWRPPRQQGRSNSVLPKCTAPIIAIILAVAACFISGMIFDTSSFETPKISYLLTTEQRQNIAHGTLLVGVIDPESVATAVPLGIPTYMFSRNRECEMNLLSNERSMPSNLTPAIFDYSNLTPWPFDQPALLETQQPKYIPAYYPQAAGTENLEFETIDDIRKFAPQMSSEGKRNADYITGNITGEGFYLQLMMKVRGIVRPEAFEQVQTLPLEKFPEAETSSATHGYFNSTIHGGSATSLQSAIAQGRVFVSDFTWLKDVPTVPGYRYAYPKVLWYRTDSQHLEPAAVKLTSRTIYSPWSVDPVQWGSIRAHIRFAITKEQASEHLMGHVESAATFAAVWNQVPPDHSVSMLLEPLSWKAGAVMSMQVAGLTVRGDTDVHNSEFLALGTNYARVRHSVDAFDYPKWVANVSSAMNDSWHGSAWSRMWEITYNFTHHYVLLHYHSDQDVRGDKIIQRFVDELIDPSKGNVQMAVDLQVIDTKTKLATLLCRLMFVMYPHSLQQTSHEFAFDIATLASPLRNAELSDGVARQFGTRKDLLINLAFLSVAFAPSSDLLWRHRGMFYADQPLIESVTPLGVEVKPRGFAGTPRHDLLWDEFLSSLEGCVVEEFGLNYATGFSFGIDS